MRKLTNRRAIYNALKTSLTEDRSVVLVGEDIGTYGGAFQVTSGLQRKFSDRIIETPISESGFCGLSIGMALAGMKPVMEVMFMDFTTQILDQVLNQAVKFNGMYNGQMNVPLLIRTVAGGHYGYGATHSQSLENIFASVHDLNIIYPHSTQDYYSTLLYSIRNLTSPTMFIEDKSVYLNKGEVDFDLVYEPQTTMISYNDKQWSTMVISYGHSLDLVLEAQEKSGEKWTIFDLVSLKPLKNFEIVLDEIRKYGDYHNIVIVSESPSYASVAEHLAYTIMTECYSDLHYPVKVVSSKDTFIPARMDLEAEVLVSVDDILEAMKD